MNGRVRSRRCGFTVVELLVVIAIIALLIALLMPAVQQAREASRRTMCRSRIKQLSLALHNYHSTHSVLPSGSVTLGPAFEPFSGWGWGAMILPYLDQGGLYSLCDFSTHTAVSLNRNLISTSLPFWFCPTDISPPTFTARSFDDDVVTVAAGNYLGVGCMLSEVSRVRFRDVTDGLSQTFLLGEHRFETYELADDEVSSSWIGHVTFADHYVFESIPHSQATNFTTINNSMFSSLHTGGAMFSFGDGSARFVSESIDEDIYAALGSRSGNEVVELSF